MFFINYFHCYHKWKEFSLEKHIPFVGVGAFRNQSYVRKSWHWRKKALVIGLCKYRNCLSLQTPQMREIKKRVVVQIMRKRILEYFLLYLAIHKGGCEDEVEYMHIQKHVRIYMNQNKFIYICLKAKSPGEITLSEQHLRPIPWVYPRTKCSKMSTD